MNHFSDNDMILDRLPQNIFIKDETSAYLYCNQTYADTLGIRKEQIVGKNDYDFFPREIADKYRKDDARILQIGKTESFDESYNDHGIDKIIHTSKTILTDTKSGHKAILGIFWDITDQKEVEYNLIKIKNSLEKAQKVAHIGNWDWDIPTGDLWWSDEIYRIFGLEPQEFGATYEAFLNTLHPDDRQKVQSAVGEALEGRKEYDIEHRIILPNGQIRHVHEQGHISRQPDGTPIHMLGTVHDITARKEAEAKLLLASKVVESTIEGVLVTDTDLNIVDVNNAFTKITGFTREEAVGQQPRMLQSGWHDKEFYRQMWTSLKETGNWQGEIWDRKKNGELYAGNLSISSIKDEKENVVNYVAITNDITEKKEWEKQIHNLAYYDVLTALPNRSLFKDRVEQRLNVAEHYGEKLAILFLDLDNFKVINDSLGHHVGDLFLKQVADRIQSICAKENIVARLGGDEFTIMMEYIKDPGEPRMAAQKILDILSKPFGVEGKEVYSGASIGISIYPDDGEDYDTLIMHADTAMYHVKEAGRNGFQFYTESMNNQAFERLLIENSLRHAVANGQLFLEYQPKVCLADKHIAGMEALVRWRHPDLGIVPPYKFISIAEETGMITEIGHWVLEEACRQTKIWHAQGFDKLKISVNVSAHQLKREDYVRSVEAVLDLTGFDAAQLELELTESALMENIDATLHKMLRLKAHGISFSIDDFGTGYSSMSYLKKLPAEVLKIDRSFVMDSHRDEEDRSIMAAIIALANSLGMQTVAEGAELEEHITILTKLGCTKVQGYYYSKPLPPDAFEAFLTNWKPV